MCRHVLLRVKSAACREWFTAMFAAYFIVFHDPWHQSSSRYLHSLAGARPLHKPICRRCFEIFSLAGAHIAMWGVHRADEQFHNSPHCYVAMVAPHRGVIRNLATINDRSWTLQKCRTLCFINSFVYDEKQALWSSQSSGGTCGIIDNNGHQTVNIILQVLRTRYVNYLSVCVPDVRWRWM